MLVHIPLRQPHLREAACRHGYTVTPACIHAQTIISACDESQRLLLDEERSSSPEI